MTLANQHSPLELDVSHVAHLARLDLREEEKQLFSQQLQEVLKHIEHLNQLDLSEVVPVSHATTLSDIVREDLAQESFPKETMIALAPHQAHGLWMVPNVLES